MKEIFEIKKEAKQDKVPIIFDDTASFLSAKVSEKKPKRILEIGTAVGYSASVMLSAFEKSKLVTIEVDGERAKKAKENLKKFKGRVKIINKDAGEVIKKLKGRFDFIFLDGPKGKYGDYFNDLISLLAEGGVLVADNIYFHGVALGRKPCTRGMRAMIKGLHEFVVWAKISKYKVEEFHEGDGILVLTKERENG